MQVTFSSEEPLEQVLAVISSLYGVKVTAAEDADDAPGAGERTVKTRHLT
ncbi:hypothetical protein [Georgenia faecalis]|uniref:Uncharacterized protein n=1 Tax=Georgenia faecalis TaxID=2483799 RepID=A0ABV9D971_9MICO|nr:hypothetical protein [Georgenia faecalis]